MKRPVAQACIYAQAFGLDQAVDRVALAKTKRAAPLRVAA